MQFRFIKLDLKMFSIRILRMSSFTLSELTHVLFGECVCSCHVHMNSSSMKLFDKFLFSRKIAWRGLTLILRTEIMKTDKT